MSNFEVKVIQIKEDVINHPNADRLSIAKIGGYLCISNKLEDGSHRYNKGDYVFYVPEGALLPEGLLKRGYWDEKKEKGILAGSRGNRVKALRLRGILSQGLIFPIRVEVSSGQTLLWADSLTDSSAFGVVEDSDVAEYYGIVKYEPTIPPNMDGSIMALYGSTVGYDFESIQKNPNMFDLHEEVAVTEKIHGTNVQIGYVPGLNDERLFGDGNIYVASKGYAGKGLVFENGEKNASNVYVKMLNSYLSEGLGDRLAALSAAKEAPVRLFGEIYGQGIQDLHYGSSTHTLAIFDIKIGDKFVPYHDMKEVAAELGLPVVPILYVGPFEMAIMDEHRDGQTYLDGENIREGIVIKSTNEYYHELHGRKIAKYVSPDYLLRNNATEYN